MEWIMNWWWVTVLGPVVLATVIAYALLNRRKLTREERARRDRATDRLYKEPPGASASRK